MAAVKVILINDMAYYQRHEKIHLTEEKTMAKNYTYNELQNMMQQHLIEVGKLVSKYMDIDNLKALEKELRRYRYLSDNKADAAPASEGPAA